MIRHTLPKTQRLRSYQTIRQLYQSGATGFIYPFRYSYLTEPTEADKGTQPRAEIMVAISKKKIPLAIHRNRRRRQIKEAYRRNKHIVFDALHNHKLRLSFIITYIGDETVTWQVLEKKIVLLLHDIVNRLESG